jgi:hypothetical protein
MKGCEEFMQITSGIVPGAKKVVIYGPEGIGKSTFVSHGPDPVFCDTEGSTKTMNVRRFDAPKSWEDIFAAINYVLADPSCCKTFVLDTADWAEALCIEFTCNKGGVNGIEDFGYGKGYTYVQENFKKLLTKLDELIALGINVFITAHAKMRKFEQPDEMGAYDRWEMKLSRQVAPMVKEWADMVLFANYKTYVVEDDKTKSKKAQGGKRVMYATHNPCWDAKNRYGLADCLPFDYEEIRSIIEGTTAQKAEPVKEPEKKETKKAKKEEPKTEPAPEEPAFLTQLKELMKKDDVSEDRLIYAVASKGGCFTGAKITDLDPVFIQKSLIDKWAGFSKYAKKLDISMNEVPFN